MCPMIAYLWVLATIVPTSSTPTSVSPEPSSCTSISIWRAASGPSMLTMTWQNLSMYVGGRSLLTSRLVTVIHQKHVQLLTQYNLHTSNFFTQWIFHIIILFNISFRMNIKNHWISLILIWIINSAKNIFNATPKKMSKQISVYDVWAVQICFTNAKSIHMIHSLKFYNVASGYLYALYL